MKKHKSYKDGLQEYRWLRKRQKILKRDGYKCTVCGADTNLQVHHTYYYKQPAMPWEYPNTCLVTVCDKCHREFHLYHEVPIIKKKVKKVLAKKVKNKKRILSQYLVQTTSTSGKTTYGAMSSSGI